VSSLRGEQPICTAGLVLVLAIPLLFAVGVLTLADQSVTLQSYDLTNAKPFLPGLVATYGLECILAWRLTALTSLAIAVWTIAATEAAAFLVLSIWLVLGIPAAP